MNILPDWQLGLIPVFNKLVLQYLREHEDEWRNLTGYRRFFVRHRAEFRAWKFAYEKLKPYLGSPKV